MKEVGNTKICIIERVNVSGKWMEFWWQRLPGDPEPEKGVWDECSKQYRFWEAFEKVYDDSEYLNKGLRGIVVRWTSSSGNWEIDAVLGRMTTPTPLPTTGDDEDSV